MLARHGWKSGPSPRRGFTVVGAARELAKSPVVVAVHATAQGIQLFETALEEAMSRTCDLVVLDYGTRSLRDELADETTDVDPRERSAMRVLWSNPHVRVVRGDPDQVGLESTVSYCESVEAALLVIGADHVGGTVDPELTRRVFSGKFDVLVVAEGPEQHSG